MAEHGEAQWLFRFANLNLAHTGTIDETSDRAVAHCLLMPGMVLLNGDSEIV